MACRNVATVETESPIAHVEQVRRASWDLQVEEKEEEPRGGRHPGLSPTPRVGHALEICYFNVYRALRRGCDDGANR